MRSPTRALAALEVAVRGRGAPLTRGEHVRVHPQAHRAPGATPLEAGPLEDRVEPLLLGLPPHGSRPGDDHRPYRRVDGSPADDRRSDPEVLDPGVRARPDEH